MKTRSDSPLVHALLVEAEAVFGHPVKTPSDFVSIADRIEAATREHISDSTIKRLWVPKLGYATVSAYTLDVIAKYCGYSHFEAFCTDLNIRYGIESKIYPGTESVRSAELAPGDMVEIAWLPDRECVLEHLGDGKFIVRQAENAKIRPGDTFGCHIFVKGKPLYVDNLHQGDKVYAQYGMGLEHGLTKVKVNPYKE